MIKCRSCVQKIIPCLETRNARVSTIGSSPRTRWSTNGRPFSITKVRTAPCLSVFPVFRLDWFTVNGNEIFCCYEESPCSLVCKNEKGDVALLKPHVTDGTPCFRGTRDVCVGGECQVSNLFLFNPPIFVYVCHETLQMASEISLFQ